MFEVTKLKSKLKGFGYSIERSKNIMKNGEASRWEIIDNKDGSYCGRLMRYAIFDDLYFFPSRNELPSNIIEEIRKYVK